MSGPAINLEVTPDASAPVKVVKAQEPKDKQKPAAAAPAPAMKAEKAPADNKPTPEKENKPKPRRRAGSKDQTRPRSASKDEQPKKDETPRRRAGFVTRFAVLCGRGFRELLRDPGVIMVRLAMYAMLSALIGAMYARVPRPSSCLLPAFASSRTRQWHGFDATQHAPALRRTSETTKTRSPSWRASRSYFMWRRSWCSCL